MPGRFSLSFQNASQVTEHGCEALGISHQWLQVTRSQALAPQGHMSSKYTGFLLPYSLEGTVWNCPGWPQIATSFSWQ